MPESFHETRFSPKISFGSSGTVERRTEIVELVSGFEERNSPWSRSRRSYDAGLGVRTLDDLHDVLTFFEARHGQLFGFRWKDWLDHKSGSPSQIVTAGDQTLSETSIGWQLTKTYAEGPATYTREITKPVAGSVRVSIDGNEQTEGADFTVDHTNGLVQFTVTPGSNALVTAGFEFDVPVRFDTDRIEVNLAAFEAGDIPSVPIVEVRL
jgi:uncharacterized protein (TIGR02217 family)